MTDLDRSVVTGPASALGWLRDALWAPEVEVAFAPGSDGDRVFLARPSPAAPELLVPIRPARATATVARRVSDARSLGWRIHAAGLEVVAATGLMPRLAPERLLSLTLGAGADDPERSLPAFLTSHLGLGEGAYAVTLGGERYNRKPVLTLFDDAGRLRAFVKVGVDPLTDRYVTNEAHWLTVASESRDGIEAPSVQWSGRWRHHAVLVTTPIHPPRLPVRRSIERPPAGLVVAVASVTGPRQETVATSPVIEDAARVGGDRLLAARRRVLDRHGSIELAVGLWHGDLSPWNLATRRAGPPLLWDWEAAADGRPVGADLLHSLVMVSTHLRDERPAAAVERLRPDDLGEHQVDHRARSAALDLYLLDVASRDVEMVADGVDPALLPGIGAAALDRLVGR